MGSVERQRRSAAAAQRDIAPLKEVTAHQDIAIDRVQYGHFMGVHRDLMAVVHVHAKADRCDL